MDKRREVGAVNQQEFAGRTEAVKARLYRTAILRFFSGCTQAETAAALRIPQGTAATRQKRALALLKLELGEEEQV